MATRKAATKKRAPARGSRGGRGKSRANKISVDFTDVEAGGGVPTPDGYYVATVSSAEKDVSSNGNEMVVVRWKTNIGSTVFDRFMLLPQSLWVLRTALDCMGFDTPDGPFEFDPDEMVGCKCGLEIINEEYEEKDQPRVTGYMSEETAEQYIEEAGGTVEPEEEEKPTRRKASKAAEEEYEDDDNQEEQEEEEPAPRATKKKAAKKKAPARKKAGGALRPGARVVFEDEEGDEIAGVIEGIEDDMAVVVDDEDGEWEIPMNELKKA